MRKCLVFACVAAVLTSLSPAQTPAMPAKADDSPPSSSTSADSSLTDMFESKIKVEWEALKNKDRKAYGELLADDYQGVEVDGRGERTKIQALNELANTNVFNYTLWGLKVIPLGPDAALVIYESTMQFPPKSVIRYSRVYISEVWVKRAGQWKELHYQETRVK
ncbi:MAG: nuclear transport factor 2 family protein [Candidatus Sulfotelmatobacter sp.]